MLQNRRTLGLACLLVYLVSPLRIGALTVSIRLFDEEIYFPDSSVYVAVAVENQTPESVQFKVADNRLFNLDFSVTDPSNRPLESSGEFIIGRTTNQVFYRTVTLEPGEQFRFIEALTDYVSLETPGQYRVQATFYPGLFRGNSSQGIASNTIPLSIRPGHSREIRQEMRFQAITEERLQRERKSPDEVVEYFLEARRQEVWDRFFLYLNLEKIYRQNPERDRRFRLLSEADQLDTIQRFRDDLVRQPSSSDAALVQVPSRYEILQTSYSPDEGRVVVLLSFDYERYREQKRYTFRLERRNGFWEIIGYNVENLPNKAIHE
ncbi:hypothetical protein AU468_02770 [Alkalispirochaeta sphaeroplastigenens]|uniref:Uncharacterized protein n=1 Tax=Alkalispirochaeta sphaeroplastigenens TaxID=1187066 RepID=A0A2S4JYW0_9SPIO|nr:hypothetical protein [Alkalispirochaeta sphaeroplastigenens]POR04693.1 hypothetical protein AU468_02770 [Alkalispirochaeta sphaeroplastigenens]